MEERGHSADGMESVQQSKGGSLQKGFVLAGFWRMIPDKGSLQSSVEERSLLLFSVVITLRTKKSLKSFVSCSVKSF